MPLGLCSGMPSRLGQQCFRVGKNRQQLAQGGPFPAGEKIALQRSAWSMTQWGGEQVKPGEGSHWLSSGQVTTPGLSDWAMWKPRVPHGNHVVQRGGT